MQMIEGLMLVHRFDELHLPVEVEVWNVELKSVLGSRAGRTPHEVANSCPR